MAGKQFDTTSKFLFEAHTRDWITLAGWPVPSTDEGLTIVDADLSTVSSAADKIVRVDVQPRPYLAHIEFQTSGDPELDARMLAYNALTRLRHKLPVRSVAFLFRPQASAGPTGLVSEHLDDRSWIDFSYRLIRIWELPIESLLTGPIGVLPLAPLAAEPSDLHAVVERINRRLRAEVSISDLRETLECTRLLLGLRFDGQLVESVMATFAKVLEDSSSYQLTLKRGVAQGVAQGISQGVAQGVAQGISQGVLQGRRDLIIRLGFEKFGTPKPDVLDRINAIADVSQLDDLAASLFRAQTWDQLFIKV